MTPYDCALHKSVLAYWIWMGCIPVRTWYYYGQTWQHLHLCMPFLSQRITLYPLQHNKLSWISACNHVSVTQTTSGLSTARYNAKSFCLLHKLRMLLNAHLLQLLLRQLKGRSWSWQWCRWSRGRWSPLSPLFASSFVSFICLSFD